MRRWIAAIALGVTLVGDADAKKSKDTDGVNVKITVLDEKQKAIPTAVIRHPDEADRHRVNSMTGSWEDTKLYMPDGTEMIFTPGMSVRFEVSAPGYLTKIIQYDIRKRKNNVEVNLVELEMDDETGIEDPMITFGRDKPRDG